MDHVKGLVDPEGSEGLCKRDKLSSEMAMNVGELCYIPVQVEVISEQS